MTQLLEKAFHEAANLPVSEQNTIAKWLLDEIESEKKWDTLFGQSQDVLEELADVALDEKKKRRTEPLDFKKM